MNGTPTRYALDPAAGLTQVLSDGTSTYLYGVGRIAQQQIEMQYFGSDALGSVRQLYNSSGQILANTRYAPYGTVLAQDGAATSIYGFTGEQLDASTGLEYLRARFYDPAQGRFVTRDTFPGHDQPPQSMNPWNYANADPVNLTDPTGHDTELPGPVLFAMCFELHSLPLHGIGAGGPTNRFGSVTAQEAVDRCRQAYNKERWPKDAPILGFEFGPDLPKTAHELFGWFVYNYRGMNGTDWLWFDAAQPLTQELARSIMIERVRLWYCKGLETDGPTEQVFSYPEFAASGLFDTPLSAPNRSLALSFTMGSFWFQTITLRGPQGKRIGYRIDNDTTLASGSHFVGRNENEGYYVRSVEDLIETDHSYANKSLFEVWQKEPVVSILRRRTKEQSPIGGGNLYQTYAWSEKYDDCDNWNAKNWTVDLWLIYRSALNIRVDIQTWPRSEVEQMTKNPPGWPTQ